MFCVYILENICARNARWNKTWSESASIGCRDCKAKFACKLNESLREIRERKKHYEIHTNEVWDILNDGTKRAREIAKETLIEVKDAMGIKF